MVDRPSAGERFTADAEPRGQIRLPPTGNLKLSVSLALSRSGCGGVILFPGGLGRLSSPAGEALRQAYLRGTDSSNSVPSNKLSVPPEMMPVEPAACSPADADAAQGPVNPDPKHRGKECGQEQRLRGESANFSFLLDPGNLTLSRRSARRRVGPRVRIRSPPARGQQRTLWLPGASHAGGTQSSNPLCSSGESANSRSPSR
jgi:hypothetical protein